MLIVNVRASYKPVIMMHGVGSGAGEMDTIKKLLLGSDPKSVINRDSMANPHSFEFFVSYTQNLAI